ncbi:hypothetical protein CHUAL_007011 [Chamberlinius hualienensis]
MYMAGEGREKFSANKILTLTVHVETGSGVCWKFVSGLCAVTLGVPFDVKEVFYVYFKCVCVDLSVPNSSRAKLGGRFAAVDWHFCVI